MINISKVDQMVGKKFHYLTIHKRDEQNATKVLVTCDCGERGVFPTNAYAILNGSTKSCGCKRKKDTVERNKANGKHGLSNTKLYHIWNKMKDRCYKKDNKDYKHYGGKGVEIHKEWLEDFMNFYTWAMNNNYKEGLSIDRINNLGNYEPSNCEWITMSENIAKRNKENSKKRKGDVV